MKIIANKIQIEVEDSGGSGPVVLLVMGLGMQLIAWPEPFVQGLVQAGYRVLRHDNRDIGLSQYFDSSAGAGSFLLESLRAKVGLSVRSPYSLQDMAADALGVLDALDVPQAHVLGVSMGGMIAQRMAAAAPQRLRSLISVMSSSGAHGLPGPRPDVGAALMRRPPGPSERERIEHSLVMQRLISSPGYPADENETRERLAQALRRAYHPAGVLRQMLAIGADTSRAQLLARIACPTLVLHGDADPLVPLACGQDSARRIAGSRMEIIPGMGHDLPPGVVAPLLSKILPFLAAQTLH